MMKPARDTASTSYRRGLLPFFRWIVFPFVEQILPRFTVHVLRTSSQLASPPILGKVMKRKEHVTFTVFIHVHACIPMS